MVQQAIQLRKLHREKGWEDVLHWDRLPPYLERSFNVPHITEHVLAYSKKFRCTIGQSVMHMRDSASARKFREYLQELAGLVLSPNRQETLIDRLLADVASLTKKWSENVDEEVRFRTRKIRLKDLPAIGKLLHAAGLDEMFVRDPVVWQTENVRSLIFLNEVLRAPAS
jgi:hypothetical protein